MIFSTQRVVYSLWSDFRTYPSSPQKEASCPFVFTSDSYFQAQATTDLLSVWTVLYVDETGDAVQTQYLPCTWDEAKHRPGDYFS